MMKKIGSLPPLRLHRDVKIDDTDGPASMVALYMAVFRTDDLPNIIRRVVGDGAAPELRGAADARWVAESLSPVDSQPYDRVEVLEFREQRLLVMLRSSGGAGAACCTPEAEDWFSGVCARHPRTRIPDTPLINLVAQSQNGAELLAFPVPRSEMDLGTHYADDFPAVHAAVLGSLLAGGAGLTILHGPPGTGKTSYIRHLCAGVAGRRKVIYVPPEMVGWLTAPDCVTLLRRNPGSVLVVEDAEDAVRPRAGGRGGGVSALLNMTDGLLGDCLSAHVICTFNAEASQVDPALLRPGRLVGRYAFGPLPEGKARALAASIGAPDPGGPATLADIYSSRPAVGGEERRTAVGFRASPPVREFEWRERTGVPALP